MLSEVRHILSSQGPIARAIGGRYEAREQQIEMALAVARAMEDRSHLLAEAGTGVGKSFAYLVPAMLRCLRGETVVIATNTIALQEQLIQKDVPLLVGLMEEMGRDFGRKVASPEPFPRGGGFEASGPDDDSDSGEGFKIKPVLVKGSRLMPLRIRNVNVPKVVMLFSMRQIVSSV